MERYTKNAGTELMAYVQGDESYRATHGVTRISQKRVEDLLSQVIRLYQLQQVTEPDDWAELEELQRDIAELNERYVQYPTIIQWQLHPETGGIYPAEVMVEAAFSVLEGRMALIIMSLWLDGALNKLRTCLCGKRFFETRQDHGSCSQKCRRKKVTSSEAHLQKRRLHYKDHVKGGKGVVGKKVSTSGAPKRKPRGNDA